MGLFDVFKNKSGKSQKSTYSCGNKHTTTTTRGKNGTTTTKTKITPGVKPRKPRSK